MKDIINTQQILKKRPVGLPDKETWELIESKIQELNDGEMLIAQEYISLDPAMRGWMNQTRSYIPPVELGDVYASRFCRKSHKNKREKLYFKLEIIFLVGGVSKIFALQKEKIFTK